MILSMTDLTDTQRNCLVDPDTLAPVFAHWLESDGATAPSSNVARLVAALRRGDWPAVHALADHLLIDVERVV